MEKPLYWFCSCGDGVLGVAEGGDADEGGEAGAIFAAVGELVDVATAVAIAFPSVIPSGNLLRPLPLLLPFWLSFRSAAKESASQPATVKSIES